MAEGTRGERRGEWHFGWILEGRAIQDVLTGPPLEERRHTGEPAREYGTSVRLYDHRTRAWNVSWFAPVFGGVVHLTGRAVGDEIVLEGSEPDGTRDRWVFSEIAADAFTWSGYESKDLGTTWPLVEQMHVVPRPTR